MNAIRVQDLLDELKDLRTQLDHVRNELTVCRITTTLKTVEKPSKEYVMVLLLTATCSFWAGMLVGHILDLYSK